MNFFYSRYTYRIALVKIPTWKDRKKNSNDTKKNFFSKKWVLRRRRDGIPNQCKLPVHFGCSLVLCLSIDRRKDFFLQNLQKMKSTKKGFRNSTKNVFLQNLQKNIYKKSCTMYKNPKSQQNKKCNTGP